MGDIFVKAPLGGVRREAGFQSQAPFTTLESINFWPRDVVTGRAMSATRPPLVPVASPGSPVNFLQLVSRGTVGAIQLTIIAAEAAGVVKYWNGSSWVAASPTVAVTTGRPVYGASYLQDAIILNDTTPLRFDASIDSVVTYVATAETVPPDARVAATWQGCMWLAGQVATPHIFYGSRTGDIFDWDDSLLDTGASFAATGENEGLIGQAVTALAPQHSDIMIIGCETSLWALRGHPRRGGVLDALSSTVGILGQGAWTTTPDGTMFFMSKQGLVGLGPNAGAVPIPISKKAIPDELQGLTFSPLSPEISMEYDVRWNGIHITVRGSQEQAWFYDLENGGFHQMSFQGMPTVMQRFDQFITEATNGVLYGGSSYNGLAQMDTVGEEDMSYNLAVGPIRLSSNPTKQARTSRMHHLFAGNTDTSSGNTQVVIRGGVTAEDVVQRRQNDDGTTKHSTTVPLVVNNGGLSHPLTRGHALMLEIGGSGKGTRIVYEGTVVSAEAAGKSTMMAGQSVSVEDTTTSIDQSFYRLYASATPAAAGDDYDDFSLFIDLSTLPTSWWDVVRFDGGDIRPTTSTNTFLPFDLLEFNKTDKTGVLVVKSDISGSPTEIRIYAGNPLTTAPSPAQALGRHNAYDANVLAFYPDGASMDRTSNALDLKAWDIDSPTTTFFDRGLTSQKRPTSPEPGNGDGFLGINSTLYSTKPGSNLGEIRRVFAGELFENQSPEPQFGTGSVDGYTLSAFVRQPTSSFSTLTDEPGTSVMRVGQWSSGTATDYNAGGFGVGLSFQPSATEGKPISSSTVMREDTATPANSIMPLTGGASTTTNKHGTSITIDTWQHLAGVSASAGGDDHSVFLDASKSADTTTADVVLTAASHIIVSSMIYTGDAPAGHFSHDIDICLFQVDNVRRDDDWITYRSDMGDQATFWGTWITTII